MLEPSTTDPPTSHVSSLFSSDIPRSAGSSSRTRLPDAQTHEDRALLAEDSKDVPDESNLKDGPGVDFFASLGTEHKRKNPKADRPDPGQLQVYKTELNKQLLEGKSLDDYEVKETKVVPGGPGFQWRMMKLKRLYEQAEEQCVLWRDSDEG